MQKICHRLLYTITVQDYIYALETILVQVKQPQIESTLYLAALEILGTFSLLLSEGWVYLGFSVLILQETY